MYGQQVGCPHCKRAVLIQNIRPSTPQAVDALVDRPTIRESDSNSTTDQLNAPVAEFQTTSNEHVQQTIVNPPRSEPSAVTQIGEVSGFTAAPQSDRPADETTANDSSVALNIEHLLPPRFDVINPDLPALRRYAATDHQVLLPDGMGGIKKVDDRIVKVKQGDREINLVSLSPAELRRRRQFQNVTFMIGGAIILAIIFALLSKSV